MKTNINNILLPIIAAACALMLGCTKPVASADTTADSDAEADTNPVETAAEPFVSKAATIHETEFGGVYIKIGIDAFNDLGFQYGDSVDVVFSNGYTLEDIPYYNGYYVDAGQPLLIAYPGYDYIKAAINYGEDLWDAAQLQAMGIMKPAETLWAVADLKEHDTADIILRERAKYLDVQESRDIHYTDIREDYPTDEVFANFRTIEAGMIPAGNVYRSASPCDNQHNRAIYVDALIEKAGVNFILNLSDNDVKIERYLANADFASMYFKSLYDTGNVEAVALSMNYQSDDFAQKIVQGFNAMAESEGPYLVHCTEGKDRTGFVCMLIEALAGASYQEIVDDYMLTYDNYYQINPVKDPEKYQVIKEKNIDAMLKFIAGDETADIEHDDLSQYAESFLKKAEMTDEQIDSFRTKICAQ